MSAPKEKLLPNAFYHVYNKAVGKEFIFKSPANYFYFLSLVKKYLYPFVGFYAYCLMPNHFHFLIQINDISFFPNPYTPFNGEKETEVVSNFISRRFGHAFNAYAQAYNKIYNRDGSLFKNRFQRKRITEQRYLKELVLYIHLNPLKIGLCQKVTDWRYSSYNAILSKNDTIIKKEEVIEWFGDLENFIFVHHHS